MEKKIRIVIIGIGAVGGYFGGMLARKYSGSEKAEIVFVARERSVKAIKENGLKIITPDEEFLVHPDIITSDAGEIGIADYIICAVKGYDLDESIRSVCNCIGPQTVILPLLNGVDSSEKIQKIYPSSVVWEGCVYIVSRLQEAGVITESGTLHRLFFGSNSHSSSKLKEFDHLLKDAGIDSVLSPDISKTVWEKYIFISSVASLTSVLNMSIGRILESETHKSELISLVTESKSIARAKGILVDDDIVELSLERLNKLPYETTSSMHSDFIKNTDTEYKSLTKYIVDLGVKLAVPTPAFSQALHKLKAMGIKPA